MHERFSMCFKNFDIYLLKFALSLTIHSLCIAVIKSTLSAVILPNEEISILNSISVFTEMYERFSMSFENFDICSNLPYLSPYINFV